MEKVLNEKYSAEYNEELRGLMSEIASVKDELFLKLVNVAVKGPLKEWSDKHSEDERVEFPMHELESCDDQFVSRICKICKLMDELVEDAGVSDEEDVEDEDKIARFAVLYKDDNPRAKREIWASIVDGELKIEMQDIGPLTDEFYGDSDRERTMSGISPMHVGLELGATNEDELMQKLIEEFGTDDGFDRLGDFLRENKIEYKYSSY